MSPDEPDLSTPHGRARAFAHRTAQLTRPKEQGGAGLTLQGAVAQMRANPGDMALVKAMSADVGAKPLNPFLAVTSPVQPAAAMSSDEADLTTTQGRAQAFKARTDELTRPKGQGGGGFTLEAAIRQMRANPVDAALLNSMGDVS